MVSVGVSVLGVTGLQFVNPGVKINGKYYRETLLKEELLPDVRHFPILYLSAGQHASSSCEGNTSFHPANTLAA